MTMLVVARHGDTAWTKQARLTSRSDIPLNSAGRTQATALGEALRDVRWFTVRTSPRRRAVETAELLRLDLPVLADERAVEVDFGPFEGRSPAEVVDGDSLSRWYDPLNPRWPREFEPFESVVDRVTSLLSDVERELPCIIVTHGYLARVLIGHCILGVDRNRLRRLRFDAGHLAAVDYSERFPRVVALNALDLAGLDTGSR
jgi:broad specificity phosphatase PhoE